MAPPEARHSTSVPERRYYGESPARFRQGPWDGLVQGWRNSRPSGSAFGELGWVWRAQRNTGDGRQPRRGTADSAIPWDDMLLASSLYLSALRLRRLQPSHPRIISLTATSCFKHYGPGAAGVPHTRQRLSRIMRAGISAASKSACPRTRLRCVVLTPSASMQISRGI